MSVSSIPFNYSRLFFSLNNRGRHILGQTDVARGRVDWFGSLFGQHSGEELLPTRKNLEGQSGRQGVRYWRRIQILRWVSCCCCCCCFWCRWRCYCYFAVFVVCNFIVFVIGSLLLLLLFCCFSVFHAWSFSPFFPLGWARYLFISSSFPTVFVLNQHKASESRLFSRDLRPNERHRLCCHHPR